MHLTSKQLFKLAFSLIGVALLVGMLIAFNANRAVVNNGLVTLDLLPQPEKLTELYFNDSANLPNSTTSKQTIHFSFVIHNLETTDYQYRYTVSVNADGTRQIVDSGMVVVKNDQYYVKHEQFTVMASPIRQDVVVELTNKRQSIDFWMGK